MKKLRVLGMIMILISLILTGCINSKQSTSSIKPATGIMVSAAGSLKPALEKIQKIYAAKNPGVKLIFNFGSSGLLQQQIEQGAGPDIYISAGKKQMDDLEQQGLILKETRVNLLGDELVVIAGKNNNDIKSFADLAGPNVKYIGIGDPATVPAAKTAQETLDYLKLTNALQPKLVRGKDLMEVLSYVKTGNAQAGFVWRTVAMTSKQVKIVLVAPENSHQPVVYPAAVMAGTKQRVEAEKFLNFLQSDEAMQVFVKYGFKKIN